MENPTAEELVRPSDFYARRCEELRIAKDDSATRYSKYMMGLTLIGLLACVVLFESVVGKRLPLWAPLLLLPPGALIVHQRHRCHVKFLELCSLAEYYDKGTARLARKWDLLEGGDAFISEDHLYSKDLDLFGHGSLYQVLCSARTQIGRETLARWMTAPAKCEAIEARNAAVRELRPRRDLPELLAAAGSTKVADFRPDFLKAWVAESYSQFPFWAPVVAFLLAVCAISIPILYWVGYLTLHSLLVDLGWVLFLETVVAGAFRSRVKSILASVETLSAELPVMRELLEIVEREHFSSTKLKELADSLGRSRAAASGRVRHLQRLIRLAKERENEWFAYPSYCLLWGTQFAMAIERWRGSHGTEMLEWVSSLGEFEALICLSTYSYEHPADAFPEVVEKGPLFEAEGLGHPLLDENTCVRNDVQLGDPARFLIVSGSNMSGKSTFHRAVGINAVLAYMGAPVRCTKLRLSALTIAAAVRIQDSVVDGRSHFFAEMQRLCRMIESAEQGALLFLVDEIWEVRTLMIEGSQPNGSFRLLCFAEQSAQ